MLYQMRILGKNKAIETTHSKPFGNELVQVHFRHFMEEYLHTLNIFNLLQKNIDLCVFKQSANLVQV
jgi:hypothetical protein